MATKNTAVRRVIAGAGALALAMAGVLASGAAASALPAPGQDGAPSTGELVVHKRVGTQGEAGNGTLIDPAPGTALPGVTFSSQRLGFLSGDPATCTPIDLSNTDHWAYVPTGAAPATSAGLAAADLCTVGAATTQVTQDPSGDATFPDLALGVYYVQETDAPADVVSPAVPFFVAVPQPNDGDFLYTVHVYPKNQVAEGPTKTVNPDAEQPDQGLVVGSTVEWTITQTVPALNEGDTYESASVWDVLPSSLAYAETTSVTVDGVPLDEGTDYTVDPDGVTWTLTGALDDLVAGQSLVVTFTTTVLEVTATGDIENPGGNGEEPGYGSEFNGSNVPGTTIPHTYWGALSVTKTDNSTPAKTLSGATFEVYAKTGATCTAEVPASGLLSTGVTGNDGVALWTPNGDNDGTSPLGLFVANSADGPLPNPSKDYCVYETVVPAGYTGGGVQTVTITPGTDATLALPVINVPKEGPDLPLTGGTGSWALTIGGLLLGGGGVASLVIARHRREKVVD